MHIKDEGKSEEDKTCNGCTDCLFSFMELTTGSKSKSIILNNRNLLIFLLKGEIIFAKEDEKNQILREREFLLIESTAPVKLYLKPNSRLVKLGVRYSSFPSISKDYNAIEGADVQSGLVSKFEARQMNDHLSLYFNQLELYFQDGMGNHNTLHELKLKELNFILKEYYAEDFYFCCLSDHVAYGSEFKNKVMNSYLRAKTVVELAQLCGYGLKSFQRMFNLHFGETPYQWMRKQMASHIEAKLNDSSIPIKQIVAEFGFSSVSHFNTYCKKYFGATPKKVRNRSNIM